MHRRAGGEWRCTVSALGHDLKSVDDVIRAVVFAAGKVPEIAKWVEGLLAHDPSAVSKLRSMLPFEGPSAVFIRTHRDAEPPVASADDIADTDPPPTGE